MGTSFGKISVRTPKNKIIQVIRKSNLTYNRSQFKGNNDGGFTLLGLANYRGNPPNEKPEITNRNDGPSDQRIIAGKDSDDCEEQQRRKRKGGEDGAPAGAFYTSAGREGGDKEGGGDQEAWGDDGGGGDGGGCGGGGCGGGCGG